jgi:hypothetical protein
MPLRHIRSGEPTVQFEVGAPYSWVGGARGLCYEHVNTRERMLQITDLRGGMGYQEWNLESKHGMGCPMWRKNKACAIARPKPSGIDVDGVFHRIPTDADSVRVVPMALGGNFAVIALNYGSDNHTLIWYNRHVPFNFPVNPASNVFCFESPQGNGLCCVGTLRHKMRQGLYHINLETNTWRKLTPPPEMLTMGPCVAYEQAVLFYSDAGSVWCLRPTMLWERTDLDGLPLSALLAVNRLGNVFEWSPYTSTFACVESRRYGIETYLALRELDMPTELIRVVLKYCRWPRFN